MKKATVNLRTVGNEFKPQEAYIVNAHFATFKVEGVDYHKGCPVKASKAWWSLTHVPTGCSLGKGPCRKDVVATAKLLSERYGEALDSADAKAVASVLNGQAQNIRASLYGLPYEPPTESRKMSMVFTGMREALHDGATW